MTNLLDIARWLPPARDFFGILLDAGLKSAAVLAAAGVAAVCMRRRSAAARHLVCFLAVASLPALPLLSWALPGWRVLPGWMALREPSSAAMSTTPSTASAPSAIPPTPRPIETALPAAPEITPPKQVARVAALGREPPYIQIVAPPKPGPERAKMDWSRAGLLAWLAGVLLALAPAVLGVLSLHRLERASRRETAASWLDLLAQLCTRLGFQRRVVLLKAAQRRMPMTWGVLRPKVLLPEESREWPPARRGVVLLHELAHAKRCDYLTLMATRLVCALYWFNPLVWLAARRMVAERERACDDIVLRHGAKPADYAEQVLEISAGLSPGWLANCGGVAMARPSNLESRLLAILDTKRNRAAVTRWAVLSALLLLTAIVVPVAMMKAAPGPQSANPQSALSAISQSPIGNPQSDWGDPTNGLRTRLVAAKRLFRAGEPILIHIEVTNTSDRTMNFQVPSAPYFNGSLILLDAEGKTPPFIGGPIQIFTRETNVAPGQTLQLEPFDLTERRYLRRPGSYSVQLPAEPFPMRMPNFSMQGLPLSGKLAFEVAADAAADADGDPVGRLLPLLPKGWSLANMVGKMSQLRPGNNHEEVLEGRAIMLYSGYRTMDEMVIWLWLTDQPAAERAVPPGDTNPASEHLGQAGRLHVYINVDANALKDWPTAKEDILRALKSLAVNFDMTPGWGTAVKGFQVRLRAPADAGAGEAWPRLLVDITNQGPMRFVSTTNSFTWQLEVDGHWYVSKDYDSKATRGRDGLFVIEGGLAMLLDIVPGQAWTNLPLVLDSAWRVAGPEEVTIQRFGSWVMTYPDNPPMKLPPGKHTVRVAVVAGLGGGPVRAVSGPVEIEVQTNMLKPGANALTGQSGSSGVDDTSPNPQSAIRNPQSDWGEPVEGVSAQLQADNTFWELPQIPRFKVRLRNQGSEALSVAQTQQPVELEVDGIWCSWAFSSSLFQVRSLSLAAGEEFGDLQFGAGAAWHQGLTPLVLGPGRHKFRFAVVAAPRAGPNRGLEIRAVSNPVEIELQWPAGTIPALAPRTKGAANVTVRGTVVDAETRQPIKSFTATPGYAGAAEPDLLLWVKAQAAQGQDGAYRVEIGSDGSSALVLAEADGYAPEMMPVGTNSLLNFALRKGNAFKGKVVDTKGRPVANAQVAFGLKFGLLTLGALAGEGLHLVQMGHLSNTDPHRSPSTFTDRDGGFNLPATAGAVTLVAVHDSGFAQVPIAPAGQTTTVQLRPWARVEGILRLGNKRLTNENVGLSLQNPLVRGFFLLEGPFPQTTTDAEGRFVFKQVPPGDYNLFRELGGGYKANSFRGDIPSGWIFVANGEPIQKARFPTSAIKTEAGKTTTVELDAALQKPVSGGPDSSLSLPGGTGPPAGAVAARIPKSPETVLAELRNILPEDWTCRLNRKPGEIKWPQGQAKQPLFRIDFTNLNISFNTEPGPPHGLRGPPHPGMPLYFLPAAEKAPVHWENGGGSFFPPLAETPDYFVVTSLWEINGGVFDVALQRSIEPLVRALEKYFGKLADERTGGRLRVYEEASDALKSDCGFAGQVVDDQTGKPIKEFTLEFSTNDPTIPGGRLIPAKNGFITSASTFFGGRFGFEGRNYTMGPMPEKGATYNGKQWWEKGQKVWPQVHADGYLTEPVTPEPVVWPVKLTNLVVRLKRAGASAQHAAQPGGAKSE